MTGEDVALLWAIPGGLVFLFGLIAAWADTATALERPGSRTGVDCARRARTAWVVVALSPVWPVLVVPAVRWAVRKGLWLWAELADIAGKGKR